MRKHLFIFCFALITQLIPAQNQYAKWYFGQKAGLDFITSPPAILTNGVVMPPAPYPAGSGEGCSTISDAAGNLLFYTDGQTIWNSSHVPMANGTGLAGSHSAAQSSIIIKQPGNTNIYFVFTVYAVGTGSCCYSIVDMNLAAGSGSVTAKNNFLFSNPTEKITATPHCNGTDIWVISRDMATSMNAYLVSATGVNTVAVVSSVCCASPFWPGALKVSPNGKKLCDAEGNSSVKVYDFDAATGLLSNPLQLGNNLYSYSCEFSPDGTKLYLQEWVNAFNLIQWNLCAGSTTAIAASQYTVSTLVGGSLQLAPNGLIYVAKPEEQYLGVINNPNVSGAGCNYVNVGQSVAPKICNYGLQNSVKSFFRPGAAPFASAIQPGNCRSFSFTASSGYSAGCVAAGYSVTDVFWNFGDAVSGTANTSTVTNPTHLFTTPGTYTVQLTLNYTCGGGADVLLKVITVPACVGIDEISNAENSLTLYPNPVQEHFSLETREAVKLTVYNELGEVMVELSLKEGTHTIDVSSFSSGVYLMRTLGKEGVKTERFVKL